MEQLRIRQVSSDEALFLAVGEVSQHEGQRVGLVLAESQVPAQSPCPLQFEPPEYTSSEMPVRIVSCGRYSKAIASEETVSP